MTSIETERLRLHALDPRELSLLLNDMGTLERELAFTYRAESVDGIFEKIVRGQLERCEKDPENRLFYTFWLMIRKSDGVAVGSFDYKNAPDENGEVEIGYGLNAEFEHNGYMTESIAALCRFSEKCANVRALTAETYLDNTPSQSILKRCGFSVSGRTETSIFWKKETAPNV